MTRDEILRLARESGVWDMLVTYSGEFLDGNPEADCLPELMRLAALIENHITWSSIHTCNPRCTKPACVARQKAVEAEREACAKVADLVAREIDDTNGTATYIAAAIRSRA